MCGIFDQCARLCILIQNPRPMGIKTKERHQIGVRAQDMEEADLEETMVQRRDEVFRLNEELEQRQKAKREDCA